MKTARSLAPLISMEMLQFWETQYVSTPSKENFITMNPLAKLTQSYNYERQSDCKLRKVLWALDQKSRE